MKFFAAFFVSLSIFTSLHADERPRLILDADTANEIDDLYAIARALCQDKFTLIALNSAQWFHYLGGERSVYASQVINRDLLRIMKRQDLPALLGADEPMGKPWGGSDAKDSDAAQFIIREAQKMKGGEKLHVACVGASTNLASAVKLAPEIAPKITAYLLGFKYDLGNDVWNKSEFNIRRDLNAADFLLNNEALELHVMPTTVAINLRFEREVTFAKQAEIGELGSYLTARWMEHSPESKVRVMWDLALIEAMLHDDSATKREVMTPPENTQRKIWIYDSIQPGKMAERFWRAVSE